MLTQLPARFEGKRASYADAGWTTYERCCAELVKEVNLDYADWKLVQVLGIAGGRRFLSRNKSAPSMNGETKWTCASS